MTNSDVDPVRTAGPPAERVVCADSVGHALLTMAVPPERRRDDAVSRVPVLGRHGDLPESLRRVPLKADALGETLPVAQIERLDAAAVARWIVGHHRHGSHTGVVLGSPHGSAVHLAVACRAAWLPTSFTINAPWPGGSAGDWEAAMVWGSRLARQIIAGNPGVTVRQVHDPVQQGPLCATTVSLQVRWSTLPDAYRDFLSHGACVVVRDLRTWPVHGGPAGYGFQIGSPTGGWGPSDHRNDDDAFSRLLRCVGADEWVDPAVDLPQQCVETGGDPALESEIREITTCHRVLYTDPHVLSAAVADLYRTLLPHDGGSHAVVSSGRMIDPWQALDSGVVPYWCESSTRAAADSAELWLAGSEPYDRITVLPEPPGTSHRRLAALTHWRSVAAFAGAGGTVDSLLAGRYPMLPVAAGHATDVLRRAAMTPGGSAAAPVSLKEAVRHLAGYGPVPGLTIT